MAVISKRGRKSKKKGRPVKTENQLIRLYEREKEEIESHAKTAVNGEKEVFKHCIDKESFNGAMYCPAFVISSFGRVWSLETESFYRCFRSKSTVDREMGYRKIRVGDSAKKINPKKNVYVHQLVCNYFCDLDHKQRDLMREADEIKSDLDLDVHHICMHAMNHQEFVVNKWDNLQFMPKRFHKAIHDRVKAFSIKDPVKRERQLKQAELQLDYDIAVLFNAYGITNKYNKVQLKYKRNEEGKVVSTFSVTQVFGNKRPDTLPKYYTPSE